MSGQISLRVPTRHQVALLALAALPPESARAMAARVGELQEPLTRKAATLVVQDELGVSDGRALVDAFISLERTRSGHAWDVAELAVAVSEAPELNVDDALRAEFAATIEAFLRLPNLRRTAKASKLGGAFERSIHTSRVLTDIRPIFEDDAAEQPVGSLIVHQLELSVWADGTHKDLYFMLDEEELEKLQADIGRALEKAETLKVFLNKSAVPLHVYPDVDAK